MTVFAEIPIAQIAPHPKNVRRDDTPDDELVASIESQGILQPLGVVQSPDDDTTFLLIGGHRRFLAAKKAGLDVVPAVILKHLVDEAQQIEAMLVENGRRVDLTATEEAQAYEQLTLLGVEPAEIASTTGRSVTTVKQRLTLVRLPETASAALHAHQITIGQAEDLVKLEAHPELLKDTVKKIGTSNFEYTIRIAVQKSKQLADEAKLREEYSAKGLPEIKMPKGGWDYQNGPHPISTYAGKEALAKADAWWGGDTRKNSYDTAPRLILTKVDGAKSEAERAKEEQRREREKAKLKKQQQEHDLAVQLRLEHVASLTGGLKIPTTLRPHLRNAVARMVANMSVADLETVIGATSGELRREKNDYSNHAIATQILALSFPQLLDVLGAALGQISTGLLHTGWKPTPETLANANAYWDAFDESGFDLPTPDKKARAGLKPVPEEDVA